MKNELMNKVCEILIADYESEKAMKEWWERKHAEKYAECEDLKKKIATMEAQLASIPGNCSEEPESTEAE